MVLLVLGLIPAGVSGQPTPGPTEAAEGPRHDAAARNEQCLGLQREGRFGEARACYEEALGLARGLADGELEARVLNNLGGVASNVGEPATALAYFEQARALHRARGDELGEATTLNNLGALHRALGELEDALLSYHAALTIFRRLGDRTWQARTLNNLGYAHLTLGELERARAYLLEALPLRQEVEDRRGETVTLRNLGRVSAQLGQPVRSLALYRRALDTSLALDDRRGAATARKLLGELEATLGRPAAARGELEAALASLEAMGNRPEQAEVLELLSRVEIDAGNPARAADLSLRSLVLHRAVRSPLGAVRALTALARAERARGKLDAAREHLDRAWEELEALTGKLGDPDQRALFLASQREVCELRVDLLMELHRRSPTAGLDREALEIAEGARSRSLLALLEDAGAGLDRGVEPELRERLREAERRVAAKTRRQLEVFAGEPSKEEGRTAEQELFAALAELDNARAEIRRRSPRYASLSEPRTLDAAAIRSLLDGDTVLLEFLLGEERSFLWWVEATSVHSYELPPRAAIEALALRVHEDLSSVHRRSDATQRGLEDLGRLLLGPVADRLRDQRLVIVADGALHLVPFAALTLPAAPPAADGAGPEPDTRGPARGEAVIARHEVVNLPSASVLASQRRDSTPRPPKARKTLAVFADPIFDLGDARVVKRPEAPTRSAEQARGEPQAETLRGGLDDLVRLPESRREAEAIAALVPAERRLVVLDGAARRSRLLDGQLDGQLDTGLHDVRILHFATHGLVDARIPELSGLMLSRFDETGRALDGFLGLHDVSNLELSADLVVLSGCRTALGKEVRGEGLVGLARGFMIAGAARVVASLWQVRDQATAELMARFYRAMLVDDLPPAAALRAAQLSLRQERRWRDPYYWAAFELQGDWR